VFTLIAIYFNRCVEQLALLGAVRVWSLSGRFIPGKINEIFWLEYALLIFKVNIRIYGELVRIYSEVKKLKLSPNR
jgi:hypothetical protein